MKDKDYYKKRMEKLEEKKKVLAERKAKRDEIRHAREEYRELKKEVEPDMFTRLWRRLGFN